VRDRLRHTWRERCTDTERKRGGRPAHMNYEIRKYFMQPNWPIAKKKVETMEAPQNRRFYGKMECLPLRPKSEDVGTK